MHRVKTAPAIEPVTLAEAKAHLVISHTDDDDYIEDTLIPAARQHIEDNWDRALITQTWVYARDHWPLGNEIRLPGGHMLSLVGVTYTDSDEVSHSFADILADTEFEPRVILAYGKSWPSDTLSPLSPIKVEYTCGYGDADDVPENVKHALKLIIGHWYERREAVLTGTISKEIEFAVSSLLSSKKVYFDESH